MHCIVATHIEPLLCAHLFNQQHLRDSQFQTHVWDRLAVHEVLLQAHMPAI